MGHKQGGVYDDCSKPISSVLKSRADSSEVFAIVRSERTANIFENNQIWRPAFVNKSQHQIPKGPECAGPVPLKTSAAASKG